MVDTVSPESPKFGYTVDIKSYSDGESNYSDYYNEDKNSEEGNEEHDEYYSQREDFSFNELESIRPCNAFPDLVSSLEIKEGEQCFVVWAVCTVGDSFETHTGGHSELLGVFKDEDSAKFLTKEVEKFEDKGSPEIVVSTPDGQNFKIMANWILDYFTNLDEVNVSSITMGEAVEERGKVI